MQFLGTPGIGASLIQQTRKSLAKKPEYQSLACSKVAEEAGVVKL